MTRLCREKYRLTHSLAIELEVESVELTPGLAIHPEPRDTLVAGIRDYLVFSDADYALTAACPGVVEVLGRCSRG